MQATTKKLPESITQFLNMPKQKQCRIRWKSLRTGFESHGDWFDMSQEESLKDSVREMNLEYAGNINHWIEYNE